MCARSLYLTKILLQERVRSSQPGSYVWFSPFLLCAHPTCVLVCACLYVCVWKCVIKVININKYKQSRDNVTCNIKAETETDVHNDLQQEVKWQVFMRVNTIQIEWNTINVSIFQTLGGLWTLIPSWPSWVHYCSTDNIFDVVTVSVWSFLYLLTRAHCAQCSPSIPLGLASQAPAGEGTGSPDRAFCIPISLDWRRFGLSFLLVHQSVWAWCRSPFQWQIRDYPPHR